MCIPAVYLMEYFHCTPQPLESAGHRADASSFLLKSSISHNYIHSVSNTMRYIRTVIVRVGTSQISQERKHFIRKTVRELLSFKFIPPGYFFKNETNLSLHHQGYRRSVEDPMQGRFYLLGHPCFSISLSQQPGTVEYTWSSFLDLGSFFGRQFFDRQGWGELLGCFKCSPFIVHSFYFFFFFPWWLRW